MSKQNRALLIVFLVLATGAVGLIAYVRASIHHLGFLTTSDVRMLMSAANEARAAAAQNKACLLTIDESSVGDTKQEAEMLYIAAMLNLYRAKFGVAARSLEELDRLRDFDQHSRTDLRRLQKHCYLSVHSDGTSVVSCGDSKPSDTDLARFTPGAEYVQRFYRLGESEILYVPVPKC